MYIDEMFVESKTCPLGVDVLQPAFSWSFRPSPERGQMQSAYRIIVSESEENARRGIGDIWDSGTRASRRNVHVLYEGPPLRSRVRYYWSVRLWDRHGRMTESPTAWWEMGLLHESDWSARWIGEPAGLSAPDEVHEPGKAPGERPPLPLFRRDFTLDKPVAQARAYICGLGHFELRLNGSKVGDSVLEPGWTDYNKTCLYCVYDVTEYLTQGANAVGIMLGNGFFHVPGGRYAKFKGSFGTPRCLIQLEIAYTDGTRLTIASDRGWMTASGPITFSCVYGGEDFDARREQAGWDRPGFGVNGAWRSAAEVVPPAGKLKAQATDPLKVMKRFRPVSISQPAPGVYVADFGQNFSGWAEITVTGPAGAQVVLTPAELLKDDGTANQKWTGSPCRFIYTLSGSGTEERWSPRFSYYGFRYVQIQGAVPAGWTSEDSGAVGADGWASEDSSAAGADGVVGVVDVVPAEAARSAAGDTSASADSSGAVLLRIEGRMIYPDAPAAGSFESSDAMLNRTHEIINWAMLSNMKSIFTDCPHREKLGWLEQVHLMGPAVAYNYGIEPLLTKTMEDIRDAQLPGGMVPTTAPEYVKFADEWRMFRDSVSWGAAYVLTGWHMFSRYGNIRILSEHYEGMKAYIDYVTAQSDGLIVRQGLGDWYDAGPETPGFAQNTPVSHTETAMFFHMVDVFAQITELLGRHEDAKRYTDLRERVKSAFAAAFFDRESAKYATGSQSSQAMPLVLGLADEPHREAVLSRLLKDIRQRGYHTTAGDVGHRYVLLALATNNRSDVIYEMSRQTDHPSYGYQIVHGATTLTEAWDGPTVGKSQNHFMLGHLEEWLYVYLAGIDYRFDPVSETYQLVIRPAFLNSMEEVKAEHRLPSGRVRVAWRRTDRKHLSISVDIPANCTADVYFPVEAFDQEADRTDVDFNIFVEENGVPYAEAPGIESACIAEGELAIRVGSGQYRFAVKEHGEAEQNSLPATGR
ncbi:alpha-L-rhamnosidase [Paenibacillus hamazuiensis]|uniref:alpha-L-rhamnosidase n=1 Tax=Paenibacillus hamazuiensis TaxID=2936508 RepID=UPI00200C707F|nr:alpha-L-rhamnosidase [Paenibacillus hamazuiensis]